MRTFYTIICLFLLCFAGPHISVAEKIIVGETDWIEVEGVPFSYLARIDTGARTTSIHALDLKVVDGSSDPDENVGKIVSFRTLNRSGKSEVLNVPIVKVSNVTNSQGTEQRYVVNLSISNNKIKKEIEVNLRDRTQMTYKLLIGRNWLANDFLVDVDLKADERGRGN